ncbi:hypothetical protein BDV10DRAFT_188469 [Aspergillus recurvatus]
MVYVVPHDPFFIPCTTLRFNLNPRCGSVHDTELIRALQKVGLWNRIRAKGGLEMKFAAADWSVGQMQLLALVRPLVAKRQVLALDETTSSVNRETETIMQETIDKEFSQQAVIAAVHQFR